MLILVTVFCGAVVGNVVRGNVVTAMGTVVELVNDVVVEDRTVVADDVDSDVVEKEKVVTDWATRVETISSVVSCSVVVSTSLRCRSLVINGDEDVAFS